VQMTVEAVDSEMTPDSSLKSVLAPAWKLGSKAVHRWVLRRL
jgi:hypothetical protein